MSPISSRKIVPPSAAWNRPLCAWTAPRERAARVAEQLRFEQRLGDRAAVDGDERLVAPRARAVDRAREQLLAGAGLAVDQHARVRVGDQARLPQQILHPRTAGDDPGAPLARHVARSRSAQSPATRSAAATFCSSSWLSNGLVRKPNTPRCVAATASGIVPCAVRMITGSAGCCAMDRLEQLQAVDARHPQVGDHDARPRDRQRAERRLAAVGRAHAVAGRRQPQADELEQIGIVVDQQDVAGLRRHHRRGRCAQPPPPPPPPPPPLPPLRPAAAAAAAADAVAQEAALHRAQRLELLDRGIGLLLLVADRAHALGDLDLQHRGELLRRAGDAGIALHDVSSSCSARWSSCGGLRKRVQHREADPVEVGALARERLRGGVQLAPDVVGIQRAVALQVGQQARELLLVRRLGEAGGAGAATGSAGGTGALAAAAEVGAARGPAPAALAAAPPARSAGTR